MNKKEILENVEEICADPYDVDELCGALEESTIFATKMIDDLSKRLIELEDENKRLKEEINKAKRYVFAHSISDETRQSDYLLKLLGGDNYEERLIKYN